MDPALVDTGIEPVRSLVVWVPDWPVVALAREGLAEAEAYVDFVICPKKGGRLVFLEVDEHEHKASNYTVLCDTTRMWNATTSLALNFSGDVNVLWLRLNPDTQFRIGPTLHKASSNTQRADAVCALLDTLEGKPTDEPMAVAYACYQMDADCTARLTRDPDYHPKVRPGVRRLAHGLDANGDLTLALV